MCCVMSALLALRHWYFIFTKLFSNIAVNIANKRHVMSHEDMATTTTRATTAATAVSGLPTGRTTSQAITTDLTEVGNAKKL